MEEEYIALFHFMHELTAIREAIKKVQTFVISGETRIQFITLNPKHFSLGI